MGSESLLDERTICESLCDAYELMGLDAWGQGAEVVDNEGERE